MTPIHAIVSRFSYPFSRKVMENVLTKKPFEHCGIVSSGRTPEYFSSLDQSKQDWFCSSDIRGADYDNIDPNSLQPLDEPLIESMYKCEAVFMEMVHRLEWKTSISYDERRQMYFRHVRFWNDYLESNNINLYLAAWNPHEIPDIVIYHLCKQKGIPIVYFHTSTVRDISFTEYDIDSSAAYLQDAYSDMLQKYSDATDPLDVPLSVELEERYQALIAPEGQKPPLESFRHSTYWNKVLAQIASQPFRFLAQVFGYCTPRGIGRFFHAWRRKRIFAEREQFYNAHAIDPDYDAQFVYLPLHFQPEASTVPMAGAFADQVLLTQLLSAHLPEGVLIYVKEHYKPSSWLCRTKESYEQLLALPNVRLVSMDASTFALREHCRAVATATGSAGFEALFRSKPVFLFGHRYYQYAKGIYCIHSTQDMKEAAQAVFENNEHPQLLESRIFLKAMEEAGIHGVLNPWHRKVSHLSDEENIQNNTDAILQELNRLGH